MWSQNLRWRSRIGSWAGLVLTLLTLAACQAQSFKTLFDEQIAAAALSCLHPKGKLERTGPVEVVDSKTFRGTLYWKGGFSDNNYVTQVEVRVVEGLATVEVLNDTSILPALEDRCEIHVVGG